jgi:hypothetical protein
LSEKQPRQKPTEPDVEVETVDVIKMIEVVETETEEAALVIAQETE